MPYAVMKQTDWAEPVGNQGAGLGYAALKVGDNLVRQNFSAYGIGIYNFFRTASNIHAGNAIEVPDPANNNIHLEGMVDRWLNAGPSVTDTGINHIVNGGGDAVNEKNLTAHLAQFPVPTQSKKKHHQ